MKTETKLQLLQLRSIIENNKDMLDFQDLTKKEEQEAKQEIKNAKKAYNELLRKAKEEAE